MENPNAQHNPSCWSYFLIKFKKLKLTMRPPILAMSFAMLLVLILGLQYSWDDGLALAPRVECNNGCTFSDVGGGSRAECNRIGCTFSDVCLTRGPGNASVDLLYFLPHNVTPPALPTISARTAWCYGMPVNIQYRPMGAPFTNSSSKHWRQRPAVLLEYFGAENFGHHLTDIWLQFFTILNILQLEEDKGFFDSDLVQMWYDPHLSYPSPPPVNILLF